jgi:hypothetical protein
MDILSAFVFLSSYITMYQGRIKIRLHHIVLRGVVAMTALLSITMDLKLDRAHCALLWGVITMTTPLSIYYGVAVIPHCYVVSLL